MLGTIYMKEQDYARPRIPKKDHEAAKQRAEIDGFQLEQVWSALAQGYAAGRIRIVLKAEEVTASYRSSG